MEGMAVWITLVLAATLTGVAFVGVLVVRRTLEPLFALLTLGLLATSAWAFGTLAQNYVRLDALFYAFKRNGFGDETIEIEASL